MNWQDRPHISCAAGPGTGPGLPTELLAARLSQGSSVVNQPSDLFASWLSSHRHLPQTQHTTNSPSTATALAPSGDTTPRANGTKPRVTFNCALHSGIKASSSQGVLFCLYSQLCPYPPPHPPSHLDPGSLLAGSLLPFLPHDLKNCKPDPLLSPGSTVSRQSLGRQHGAARPLPVSDQLQGPLPQCVSLGWPHGATKLSHLQPFNKWPLGLDHALHSSGASTAPNLQGADRAHPQATVWPS